MKLTLLLAIFGLSAFAQTQTWGLSKINVPTAWSYLGQGSSSTVVAVLDTGIDPTHPSLSAHLWSAPFAFTIWLRGIPYYCPAGTHGFDVIAHSCTLTDPDGHGTGVAGVIAQVAPGVRLLPVRMNDNNYSTIVAHAQDAVNVVLQIQATFGNPIKVLNNSWRMFTNDPTLFSLFQQAATSGIAIVNASGDDGSNIAMFPQYPPSWRFFPNGFTVLSTDQYDGRWGLSNTSYGSDMVNIGAPGVSIYTAYLNHGFAYGTGTSLAAPFVSGTLALMQNCAMRGAISDRILAKAVPIPAGYQYHLGNGGRLDAGAAARYCTIGK